MTHTVHMDLPIRRDPVNTMAEALRRAGGMMATDSRDWSRDRSDVWLYGLLVGWECEERHEHDEACGGESGLLEVAALHGWYDETVDRLRGYRAAITAVTAQPGGIITVDKQLNDAEMDELRKKWLTAVAKGGHPEVLRDYPLARTELPAPRRRWRKRRNR